MTIILTNKQTLKFGIKYCGGCNPRYDRVAEVEKIKERLRETLPDSEFIYVDPKELYDYVLVACGCQVKCANHADLKFTRKKFVMDSPAMFEAAFQEIVHDET
ncbi:MAG: hypothetical protein LBQ96_06160 [Fusobacteriaceae bacterium]|jgi:hypothetical protein|nr:hypothetical protein [Fusobacteriaceae bacterium]